jgi:hypothetical protein
MLSLVCAMMLQAVGGGARGSRLLEIRLTQYGTRGIGTRRKENESEDSTVLDLTAVEDTCRGLHAGDRGFRNPRGRSTLTLILHINLNYRTRST